MGISLPRVFEILLPQRNLLLVEYLPDGDGREWDGERRGFGAKKAFVLRCSRLEPQWASVMLPVHRPLAAGPRGSLLLEEPGFPT